MGRLFLLFTLAPLVELYLLLQVGDLIGFWPTVAMVVLTAFLGSFFARREGIKALREWQSTLSRGRMPEEGLLGAVLILVGGVLLVAPGVLTDLTGLLLLVPPSRRLIARVVRRRLEQSGRFKVQGFGPVAASGPEPSEASWEKATRSKVEVEDAEVVDPVQPERRPEGP